jgi:hypothetical protein
MLVHLDVSLDSVPIGAVFGQSDQTDGDQLFHELSAVVAAHDKLFISGWPLISIQNPSLEVREHFFVLEGVMEPDAHIGSPGDGTDVDDVPTFLRVIHIYSH